MPNHVTTEMVVAPEIAFELIHEYTPEEHAEHRARHERTAKGYKERTGKDWEWPFEPLPAKRVTFAKLVPPPANLETDGCSHASYGADPDKVYEDGTVCWYAWQSHYWGTKWDAYSSSIEPTAGDLVKLRFDTAWSHPLPVVMALSKKYPAETIAVQYADEDLGTNLGRYLITDGEVTFDPNSPNPGSNEAVDFAHRLKYGEPAPAEYFQEA